MSEKRNPLHMLLKIPFVYRLVQSIIGKEGSVEFIYKDFINPKKGEEVLDLGCGPARNRKFLEDINYTGVDFNFEHVESAKLKYPSDKFVCSDAVEFLKNNTKKYDKILLMGVLHHMDDNVANSVMKLASKSLKKGGKVYAVDAVFEKKQNIIAYILAKLDQGQNVRYQKGYELIAKPYFKEVSTTIRRDLHRFPYSLNLMVCHS